MGRIVQALLVSAALSQALNCQATELNASWYSVESLKKEGTFKKSKGVMANGKMFNERAFTCATRLWPLGTKLQITNKKTQRKVAVIVTDRIGKRFAKTRIDLSKAAFQEIGRLCQGVIPVSVEVGCE